MEGGIEGMSLYREAPLPRNKLLPGQRAGPLKQSVEASGRETAQHQQYPFAGAQVQVDPGNILRPRPAEHPPVFRPDLRQLQPPQLLGTQALQPKQGGHGQLQHFFHPIRSISYAF